MNQQSLRQDLLAAWECTYLHDDGVTPLHETLGELKAVQALTRRKEGEPNIWEIVLHPAIWNENIVERIQNWPKLTPGRAWPDLPDDPSEPAWQAAPKSLWKSLERVKQTLAEEPFLKVRREPIRAPRF